jgi:hypothetical protein
MCLERYKKRRKKQRNINNENNLEIILTNYKAAFYFIASLLYAKLQWPSVAWSRSAYGWSTFSLKESSEEPGGS